MASYAARLRTAYPFKAPSTSVDHLVVGGGVVGLSVAAGLVNTAGRDRTTFVVERRGLLGQETTARNSEVIHSGIYYPVGSLKSRFCIRGRDLLYKRAAALDIRHRKTGKLIVATDKHQIPYLDQLNEHTQHPSFSTGGEVSARSPNSVIPAYFLSGDEAREMEPDLSPDVCAALYVPDTGIVDSAGLVDSLAREIEEEDYLAAAPGVGVGLSGGRDYERGEGVVVPGTRVVRVDREENGPGWVVQLETGWEGIPEGEKGEVEAVRADVVIDAAGLNCLSLTENLVPEKERLGMWISKGNYMSYKGPGVSNIQRLIYPCPGRTLDHLGTHLTLDLDGNVRFGPDAEPLGTDADSRANPDYWTSHLAASEAQLEAIGRAAREYLPGVDASRLTPDYAGFRPNIRPPGAGFFDFVVRHAPERRGLVELMGFASPGLTSSLAAGEYVARLVRREVWNEAAGAEKLAEGWEL
ncbi:L-2-hydroxyglutarate dehydrogenase, mitochondrial [Vanrija pseudolonga]|uniref:L-2-hydroxyglutarate dehydrogenase, mitochondrial n=1 Tax=Vanrija pseudolonga TaxID=143232 RepID=A0AAF0Y768_9TREE|nr:L-2-hydroxyglutarate dehydrogenase, mitochondrial [Vanrija pseudolonga]